MFIIIIIIIIIAIIIFGLVGRVDSCRLKRVAVGLCTGLAYRICQCTTTIIKVDFVSALTSQANEFIKFPISKLEDEYESFKTQAASPKL